MTEFSTGTVQSSGEGGRLVSYDEREVPFDLAVIVPLHGGAGYVGRSPGLGDELGFVAVDPHTVGDFYAMAAGGQIIFTRGGGPGRPCGPGTPHGTGVERTKHAAMR